MGLEFRASSKALSLRGVPERDLYRVPLKRPIRDTIKALRGFRAS